MDDHQKVIRPASLEEVRQLLALAEGDDVQQIGLDSILGGCAFFLLEGAEAAQFAYATKPQGRELWIQAAGGRGPLDLTKIGFAAIECQARGRFDSVGFQTRRPGLVKKAAELGYTVDGYILRKTL